MAKAKGKGGDVESEVWAAIAAFEQILEAMPNDRASLDALADAYEQIGDLAKAKEYLVRLGSVLVEEGDIAGAQGILEKVKGYAADDPEAEELVAQIEALGGPAPVERPKAKKEAPKPGKKGMPKGVRAVFNMADELSCAWNLMEAGELTQEEYASVVQDLTDMSSGETEHTISVLHVLEGRQFKNLDKIMGYVAKQCETPIISLSNFELRTDVFGLIPDEFTMKCGAVAFETLGDDVLVAILNPYNTQIRKDVKAITGRTCHFFLAMPSEFDQLVTNGKEAIAEKALLEAEAEEDEE